MNKYIIPIRDLILASSFSHQNLKLWIYIWVHIARRQWSQDLNPDNLIPEAKLNHKVFPPFLIFFLHTLQEKYIDKIISKAPLCFNISFNIYVSRYLVLKQNIIQQEK